MENRHPDIWIAPQGLEQQIELHALPAKGPVFAKALCAGVFRPSSLPENAQVKKARITLADHTPDQAKIVAYKDACGFSGSDSNEIPITFLQTLFIGLLGRFITSRFFPLNPLGLIHIFQSVEQKRPVKIDETLDLDCILSGFNKTRKGIETHFVLEVNTQGEPVWQGKSVFLTRDPKAGKRKKPAVAETFLETLETIRVPSGTGRAYAAVSGDYNPHHLYDALARLFGFRQAIAHGMWSLARAVAGLEKAFGTCETCRIEAAFKLPVFMPADIVLGAEQCKDEEPHPGCVFFELRDEKTGRPHLKGKRAIPVQG